MHDFRSFVNLLEESGDVVHIKKEVDPKFVLPALVHKLELAGKAFVFENVTGAKLPLIGGLLLDLERVARVHKISPAKKFTRAQHADLVLEATDNPIASLVVNGGPTKEVINIGDDVDVYELPVPTFFEDDTGPFITGAVGITRNPSNGVLNVGCYRGLIVDKNKISINASTFSDLRRFYQVAEEAGEDMHIALAIGVHPALMMAAASKTPNDISEFDVASALAGQPLELVKCETSDLLVPADAEIVIEGKIDFDDKIWQTLGEFPGQYGPEIDPVTEILAITRRKDSKFFSVMAGPALEHANLGYCSAYDMERLVTNSLKKQFPNIKDLNLMCDPPVTGPMFQLFISIDKKDDEEPNQLIRAAFEAAGGIYPISRIVKRIVVVDEDVDIKSYRDIEWAIWSRVADESKILLLPGYLSWEVDRASDKEKGSVRVGIDATKKLADVDKLKRPVVPGYDDIRLEDYL